MEMGEWPQLSGWLRQNIRNRNESIMIVRNGAAAVFLLWLRFRYADRYLGWF